MKKMEAGAAFVVAFIYVMTLFSSAPPVMGASGSVSTDRPVYPIWGLGGTVNVTVHNFAPNFTYYLWLQKANQPVPYLLNTHFTVVGTGAQPPIPLTITRNDAAGTYTLTVSNSASIDTRETAVHFGVSGTDSQMYERTRIVTLAGGGFAPNSSISLAITASNVAFAGFPINVTTDARGAYEYTFKLTPSATTGPVTATANGPTFDNHRLASASSTFTVQPATIKVTPLSTPPSQLERTVAVNATYELSYPDGSPVSAANGTVDIVSGGMTVASEPLLPINNTAGEWGAVWVPPSFANTTAYHFSLISANLIDPFGNKGQDLPVSSKDFDVVTAKLQPAVQTNQRRERTQNATITISALYPSGANVANVTRLIVSVAQPDGMPIKLPVSLGGPEAKASFKIPVNATLGNWTVTYSVQDPWGNSASGTFRIQVVLASPVFLLGAPATVQRTTILNVTARVSYPDGTIWNKTIAMVIIHGNQTLSPKLSFNSTTLQWSGSHYFGQNDTLGPYNVTWAGSDLYGNGGAVNSTTLVIPAQFRFFLKSNDSTVPSFSNLDLPITVTYPNGTRLPNSFGNVTYGNVTASYQNSTGYIFTLPLAYNATNGTWHMYFSTPEEGNFTFSFSGVDRFGNAGQATDAFNLEIIPSSRMQSQRLIIAGVVGALIPVGLLTWAIATISTRRRKHKP